MEEEACLHEVQLKVVEEVEDSVLEEGEEAYGHSCESRDEVEALV